MSLLGVVTRPAEFKIDLVYEYVELDLATLIKKNHTRMRNSVPLQPDARQVKSVLFQVLTGLAYLHQNWVMHRDLKPANILLSSSPTLSGRVKIGE